MLLYQLVEQHYPDFNELRAREGRSLPGYVQEEFDAYLRCGRRAPPVFQSGHLSGH
jgi:hypothetical protein